MDEGYSNPPKILAVFAHDNDFDYEEAYHNSDHLVNLIDKDFNNIT